MRLPGPLAARLTSTLFPEMSIQPSAQSQSLLWRTGLAQWTLIVLSALACVATFYPGLQFMVQTWGTVEEYSYGYFMPLVSAFLIWQRSDRLRTLDLKGSWSGFALVALALALGVIGNLSAIRLFSQYGFIIALFGIAVCLLGWQGTRIIAVPLAILVFMIPMPQFLLRELSEQLQLVSSQIGVALLRVLDISVYLEGNVIDLGTYKLQVVEACSGLRYLFPLMVLGFLAAYMFRAALWKRVLVVASTVPLTILINSLRIALIGVTVEHWGGAMAEGLLHDFEGFFMFMVCIALLIGEMSLLTRLGGRSSNLQESFGLEYPPAIPKDAVVRSRTVPASGVAACMTLAVVVAVLALAPNREQIRPRRLNFAEFPLTLGDGWHGRTDQLDPDVIATLAVDDYLLVNYSRADTPPVNLYSAYYDSQSSGASSHSPRTCIPGGGWAITSITEVDVPNHQGPLRVNRAMVQRGEQRQLVYYWFSQRGRTLTNELWVKWYILADAITRHRSDGALLRVVTPLGPAEPEARADQRLADLLEQVQPRLAEFVPQ